MKILQPGRNCCGIFDLKEAGVIIDGENYFRAFERAAERARRYLLLAGWQFDSDVRLGRGANGEGLARFIKRLTEEKPALEVYLLAWDFSALFALDREWFQKLIFEWTSRGRVHFRFDDRHAVGASHHQKLVVVDGELAFVGGLDISSGRWDTRPHRTRQPLRADPGGSLYGPYHDIQAFVTGTAARELAGLFRQRWEDSGGGRLDLPEVEETPVAEGVSTWAGPVIPIEAPKVAISRTRAKTLVPLRDSMNEIRNLYSDAIRAAQRHVYLENQFFSSEAVYRALHDRMTDARMGPLEVVVILPEKPHTVLEEISPGLAQVKMLKALKKSAEGTAHRVGVYFTTSSDGGGEAGNGGGGPEVTDRTHVHSKLLIVDDGFVTIGSANATNRSMGLDTELNLAWEAERAGAPLEKSIRRIRASLLIEHTGLGDPEARRTFARGRDVVGFLDRVASQDGCRLHKHRVEAVLDGGRWIAPEELQIEVDPEQPIVEENVFELIGEGGSDLFRKGIIFLNETLGHRADTVAGRISGGVAAKRRGLGRILVAAVLTAVALIVAIALILR